MSDPSTQLSSSTPPLLCNARPHTQPSFCKKAAQAYVECTISKEFVSGGTWNLGADCLGTFLEAMEQCLAFSSLQVASVAGPPAMPAFATAGILGSKTSVLEGYLGVVAEGSKVRIQGGWARAKDGTWACSGSGSCHASWSSASRSGASGRNSNPSWRPSAASRMT